MTRPRTRTPIQEQSPRKSKSKDKVPIENVEFVSSNDNDKDKDGWGKAPMALNVAYDYQHQPAYYAQPLYLPQQQQYPGYAPWPPCYQGVGYPVLHLPTLRAGTGTPVAAATSPSGSPPNKGHSHSSDEDECVGLLPRKLAKATGYGSTKGTSTNSGRTFTFSNVNANDRDRPEIGRTRSYQHPLQRTTSANYNSHVQKPPMSNSSRNLARKPASPKHGRSHSLSAAPLHRHRRTTSNASSVGAGSLVSEASFMSITADIRKSAFYGGVDETTGKTTWKTPNQNIFVCTDNPALVVGHVYKVSVHNDAFEEYHRQAQDRMWEDDYGFEEMEGACKCKRRKDPALPGNQFALAVDPTIYQRVLNEISQAQSMPCGLFFCGHHEDVAHPSISIALVMVIAVFVILGTLAYMLPA
jgi:hypothetical protein